MAETISTPPVRMDIALKDNSIIAADMTPVALLQNSPLAHTLRRLKHENGNGNLSDSTEETNALDANATAAGSVSTSNLLNSPSMATFRCERCDNFETTSRASLLLHVVQCLSSPQNSNNTATASNAVAGRVKGEETGSGSGGEQDNNNRQESESEQNANKAVISNNNNQNGSSNANATTATAAAAATTATNAAGNNSSRKVFECDVCNMKFSNGANMRRHKMRHTGVKPYECRVCQKR